MSKMLRVMRKVPIRPAVYRTWDSKIFLKVIDAGPTVVGLGIGSGQSLSVIKISEAEFKKFYKPMDHITVGHTINKWMEYRNYIPISPKLEEVVMAIMAFDKEYRPAGKFASVEDAVEACPEHGIVVSSDGELEGLTITQLTAIYNSLVKGNIKKFENKAIATKRTGEAMDAYENPEPINPAPRKRSKKMTTENKEPTARDILRDFLTVGKEFTMDEVAELLETSKANATVTVNLLKKRPGVKYNALVTEKTEDGKYKVVEAPTAKPVEEGE